MTNKSVQCHQQQKKWKNANLFAKLQQRVALKKTSSKTKIANAMEGDSIGKMNWIFIWWQCRHRLRDLFFWLQKNQVVGIVVPACIFAFYCCWVFFIVVFCHCCLYHRCLYYIMARQVIQVVWSCPTVPSKLPSRGLCPRSEYYCRKTDDEKIETARWQIVRPFHLTQ